MCAATLYYGCCIIFVHRKPLRQTNASEGTYVIELGRPHSVVITEALAYSPTSHTVGLLAFSVFLYEYHDLIATNSKSSI